MVDSQKHVPPNSQQLLVFVLSITIGSGSFCAHEASVPLGDSLIPFESEEYECIEEKIDRRRNKHLRYQR
jgi:hypothetical protein